MIELKNVTFWYGEEDEKNGIENINLKINDGEFVIITGGSGCGKTTITRLINGLIPNYYEGKLSGSVLINNKDIKTIPISTISTKVGSVFQNPRSQFFNVDTTSELAFAPENHGVDIEEIDRRINSTVKKFKIEKLMDRSLFKLSGGEKQKIACACVSVAQSEIIVLDEPSSNLDIYAIEDLKRILKLWKEQGRTVVIAEHRLYFLKDLADRMIVMNEGKITHEIAGSEIRSMSIDKTRQLGIRPFDMQELRYSNDIKNYSRSDIIFSRFKYTYPEGDKGIDIDNIMIKKGSVTAIIGHNGAGKSTFAKCLCGLEKKCHGVMTYEGSTCDNKDRLKNCYLVMQDVNHQLFTEDVLDEVTLSMGDENISDEEKEAKAKKILKSMDLDKFVEKHPMALSGGQKQRVAIASAVASRRKVIIFDEPTSGLDYRHMMQTSDSIKQLAQMGKTILVITHDLEFILSCCTSILHLENGKVEELYELTAENADRLKRFFLAS